MSMHIVVEALLLVTWWAFRRAGRVLVRGWRQPGPDRGGGLGSARWPRWGGRLSENMDG